MAIKTLQDFGTPCRIITSDDIGKGILNEKEKQVLLVPGGSARLKARSLGQAGLQKIRKWLAAGGEYIGFCGGAGLALDNGNQAGLKICPIKRADFSERINHFFSGHVKGKIAPDCMIDMPVWWPGRFACGKTEDIEIIASYGLPCDDLYLGENNFAEICGKNADNYKMFPENQPLAIAGKFGKGRFLLSYSHLETPGSGDANKFFSQLLQKRFLLEVPCHVTGAWNIFSEPVCSFNDISSFMLDAWRKTANLMDFFSEREIAHRRYSWLYGWKRGFPGIILHNLLAYAWTLAQIECNEESMRIWRESDFKEEYNKFEKGMNDFWPKYLDKKRDAKFAGAEKSQIFGHPVNGGGLVQPIISFLEKMIILNFQKNRPAKNNKV